MRRDDLATSVHRSSEEQEWSAAIREFDQAIGYDPEYADALQYRGWAYLKTGRTEEGLRELSRSVESAPGNTMLLAQLGYAFNTAFGMVEHKVMVIPADDVNHLRFCGNAGRCHPTQQSAAPIRVRRSAKRNQIL